MGRTNRPAGHQISSRRIFFALHTRKPNLPVDFKITARQGPGRVCDTPDPFCFSEPENPAAVVPKIIYPTRLVSTSGRSGSTPRFAAPPGTGLRAVLHTHRPHSTRMSLPVCTFFPAVPLAGKLPVMVAPSRLPSPQNKPPALRSRRRIQHAQQRAPGWRGRASLSPGFSIKRWFGSCCFWKAHFDSLLLLFGIAPQPRVAVSECIKCGKKRSAVSRINRRNSAR